MSDVHHVVVTGAGGFVGGYVARWLAEKEHQVTAVVGRSGTSAAFPRIVNSVSGDLCDRELLPAAFDSVIHCAAEIPARCPDPQRLYETNVLAARVLFERALEADARSVVFMSSMSVYGRVAASTVHEALEPVEPDSYGRSKLDGEALLEEAVRDGLTSGLAIRLPGTVGRSSHDNFLSAARDRARRGESLQARNEHALFNNIVFVADLARFLEEWAGDPMRGYSVTNLAAAEPVSIREVFTLLFESLGLPERVTYTNEGKPPFLIDLHRAISLGYKPATVRQSIKSFVEDSIGSDSDPAATRARAELGARSREGCLSALPDVSGGA